jgi:acetyltransferase-like isoleucine patch superfamily enzyme
MRHAVLGSNCVVLPGVVIGESSAIGAFSMVKTDIPPFTIAVGVPARVIRERASGHRALANGSRE